MLSKRIGIALLLVFVCPKVSSLNGTPQSKQPQSQVVLEVWNVNYGIFNFRDEWLLVRLTSDGTVDWETTVALKSHKRHDAKVSAKEVTAIAERLRAIDGSGIKDRMGPYNTYTDTSVELKIQATLATGRRRFSVINPFPGYMPKPMPSDVKAIACEIYKLRSKVASEPLRPFCDGAPNQSSRLGAVRQSSSNVVGARRVGRFRLFPS